MSYCVSLNRSCIHYLCSISTGVIHINNKGGPIGPPFVFILNVPFYYLEHKDTKLFNKNPHKSYKNIYVRFLKIFVLYFFVPLCLCVQLIKPCKEPGLLADRSLAGQKLPQSKYDSRSIFLLFYLFYSCFSCIFAAETK